MKVKVRYSVEYTDVVEVDNAHSILSKEVDEAVYQDICNGPRKGWVYGSLHILDLYRVGD